MEAPKGKEHKFTPEERAVIEEAFAGFNTAITIIAKLHGIKGAIQLSEDRSSVWEMAMPVAGVMGGKRG
jgi:hypothetical protein